MDDTRPRERLIDPLRIATHGDQTYLIAWDVEVDAQRSYRMDKIEGLALTDDSVERHGNSDRALWVRALAVLPGNRSGRSHPHTG